MQDYYITLCGDYPLKYVVMCISNKELAYRRAVKEYGLLNVSSVYTLRSWQKKYIKNWDCIGRISTSEEIEFKKRKKII